MLGHPILLPGSFGSDRCSRTDLVADKLGPSYRLAALARPARQRPALRARDRLNWIVVRWFWRA